MFCGGEMARKDRRVSIRAITEHVDINKGTARQLLREELNMRKVCAKLVYRLLMAEQKMYRKVIGSDTLESIERTRTFSQGS